MIISLFKTNTLKKAFLFNKVLLILFIVYFCLPKVGLASIDKFEIRVLDIVSILISLIVLSKIRLKGENVIYLSCFIILQIIVGYYYSNILSLLYLFRFFQYLLLGYGFYLLMMSSYRLNFLYTFFIIQVPICIMQYLRFIPNYDPGRGILYSSEFTGTFGTPAELAYFLIALVAIFMNLGFIRHLTFSLFTILNGVAFASMLMVITGLKRLIALLPRLVIIFFPYFILLSMVLVFIDLNEIKNLISDPGFDTSYLSKGQSFNINNFDGPTTLLMRSVKFIDTILYMLNNFAVLLFGCGYGCGYGAMDSGIVRLVLEFGVLFTILVFFLSRKISKYLLFVLISINFLFDGFWSSHVAPLLFAGIFMSLAAGKSYKQESLN